MHAESIIPIGLCQCGCGQPTTIAKKSSARYGWIKGQPIRYRKGHHYRFGYEQKLPTPVPLTVRFWNNVQKSDGCWLWIGHADEHGYGRIGYGGRTGVKGRIYFAHRISWELHNGPIPEGMCVCHRCDVPACIRPDHLFLGTQTDNIHDMWRKGRASPPPH